jgi:hypothetical protein
MPRRPRATITELRQAVECLPRATRVAMLEGLDAGPIIAGAYATGDGICPMLAAHRAGGRCSAAFFADAWDRFAFREGTGRRAGARRATEREVRILRTHLEASLLDEELGDDSLSAAANEHRRLRERRRAKRPMPAPTRPRPGDPDRSGELRGRLGWAWSRLFRRYDEYELALRHLRDAAGSEAAPRERDRAGARGG